MLRKLALLPVAAAVAFPSAAAGGPTGPSPNASCVGALVSPLARIIQPYGTLFVAPLAHESQPLGRFVSAVATRCEFPE